MHELLEIFGCENNDISHQLHQILLNYEVVHFMCFTAFIYLTVRFSACQGIYASLLLFRYIMINENHDGSSRCGEIACIQAKKRNSELKFHRFPNDNKW